MPPKAKDKKGKQEVLPVGADYTRRYSIECMQHRPITPLRGHVRPKVAGG